MNALHSTSSSAVVTRLHDIGRSSEKSGVTNMRGCVRSAGRQHLPSQPTAEQPRSTYMTVVDAPTGDVGGNGETRTGRPRGSHHGGGERGRRSGVHGLRPGATGLLYATAYHLTGDRFEAEDLLQSALFSTYRAWDRISDKAAVGGYLRRTMTNLHISAWRRRKLNEYPTEELPETVGDTDAMRGTELRAVLWQALARLPELQRTMLVLRYYEGRTDPEIASILDISVGTVKSSIWRSLRRLREDEVLSFGRDEQESFGELVA